MNRQLHEQGVHTLISVWPRFEKESRYFDLLASKGWLLRDKDGKPVDGLAERSDRAGALIDSTTRRRASGTGTASATTSLRVASTGSG